jgi:hypothetical protein
MPAGLNVYPFDRPFTAYTAGHILGGVLTAAMSIYTPLLSLLLFSGFTIYEWGEQEKINDDMYRDYVEFLLGMFAGAIILCLTYIR